MASTTTEHLWGEGRNQAAPNPPGLSQQQSQAVFTTPLLGTTAGSSLCHQLGPGAAASPPGPTACSQPGDARDLRYRAPHPFLLEPIQCHAAGVAEQSPAPWRKEMLKQNTQTHTPAPYNNSLQGGEGGPQRARSAPMLGTSQPLIVLCHAQPPAEHPSGAQENNPSMERCWGIPRMLDTRQTPDGEHPPCAHCAGAGCGDAPCSALWDTPTTPI